MPSERALSRARYQLTADLLRRHGLAERSLLTSFKPLDVLDECRRVAPGSYAAGFGQRAFGAKLGLVPTLGSAPEPLVR